MRLLLSLAAVSALLSDGAQSNPARVELRTFQFTPDTLRVTAGSKVIWTNQDDIAHTVTGGTPEQRDGVFSAVLKTKGSTVERTFENAGTFTYFCDRHQFMRGTITITR